MTEQMVTQPCGHALGLACAQASSVAALQLTVLSQVQPPCSAQPVPSRWDSQVSAMPVQPGCWEQERSPLVASGQL